MSLRKMRLSNIRKGTARSCSSRFVILKISFVRNALLVSLLLILFVLYNDPPEFRKHNSELLLQSLEGSWPPILPIRPNLPDLSSGGVVIFFHLPKTGGSSIKAAAEECEKLEYYSNQKHGKQGGMAEVKSKIKKWLSLPAETLGPGKKVKFVELHWDLESLVSLDAELTEWRRQALENKVPLFVFTMIRDPLSTYISLYNYFCIYLHKGRHVKCPGPWTVDHMIQISPDNPQTRWICHATTMDLNGDGRRPLSNCDHLRVSHRQLDWIGALERFEETVEIFNMMNVNLPRKHKNKLSRIERIEARDLSKDQMNEIERNLTIDASFVDWVKKTYVMEKFRSMSRTMHT